MSIDLKCDADAFAGFSSGMFKAIIVQGKIRPWGYGTRINLHDSISVRNCSTPAKLDFTVSQLVTYMGAATIETAIDDVRRRFIEGAEGYEDLRIYVAPDNTPGFAPRFYEGIHAIVIRPSDINSNGGGENQRGHSDSGY